ncbi:cation:proton antiporter, partial [Candidatus Woesearchaeota archaeon]|nr:cation:proton antiporter [Candidatus Woesearchaeota archaeon]
ILVDSGGMDYIGFLSNLGIIFLLFITGLEINIFELRASKKEEGLIAFFSAVLPFALGFLTMKLLGFSNLMAFVVGASISVTSEGTKAVILMEFNKLKSKLGTIMLGAGILDDFFEIGFLSALIIFTHTGIGSETAIRELQALPIKILLFIMIIVLLFKLVLPRLVKHAFARHSQLTTLSFIIVFFLIMASLSLYFGLGPIIGAFIAGVLVQMLIHNKRLKERIVREIKDFAYAVIIPFFFIQIGLNFNPEAILKTPVFFLILLIVAVIGKLFGSLMVKPFSKLRYLQLYLIGWGMNSRGAVGLVIAEMARSSGIISIPVYSTLVLVATITTLVFPFVLRYYLTRYPDIMDA